MKLIQFQINGHTIQRYTNFGQFLLENLNYKDFQVFKPIIGMN